MLSFQEFSSQDDQSKLSFLKNADFQVRGFKIVGMFEKIETVEQMRNKIKELKELSDHDPCERKFFWIIKNDNPIDVITLRPALNIITMASIDNIASRTMIEKSGGEYWDAITASDGEKLARYWIESK